MFWHCSFVDRLANDVVDRLLGLLVAVLLLPRLDGCLRLMSSVRGWYIELLWSYLSYASGYALAAL
jgi:hypothetical protein